MADKGRCNYCHVEDRASDEKMQKVTARNMILMVRDINARFPDGTRHVTCYTCQRGSTTPATATLGQSGAGSRSSPGRLRQRLKNRPVNGNSLNSRT